ncbi:MAG TPA: hypothetical protein PKH07_12045, partial [bacterium]|nr:hypothetical protein [bacterium]
SLTRLTYVHYSDDRSDDDWYLLEIWQRLTDEFRLHARTSMLDNNFQMGSIDLYYLSLNGELDVIVTASRWSGISQQSRQYSPIYQVLGDQQAFTFLSARATQSVLPWLSLSCGAAARLADDSDRQVRDRQYGTGDVTLIVQPTNQWTFSLAGEYWDVSAGDHFWGITGEVEYRPDDRWEAALGTGYLDYQYHEYSDLRYYYAFGGLQLDYDGTRTMISPDVYTCYGRLKHRLNQWTAISMRGEIENNSLEDNTAYCLRTSLDIRF